MATVELLNVCNFLDLQCALRPVSVVAPDCERIIEALLLSCGFTEVGTLSSSLAQALDTFKCQVHVVVYYIILHTLYM